MTIAEAIVSIFAMFFFVILMGILSHHNLESQRLCSNYYKDYNKDESESTSPEPFN